MMRLLKLIAVLTVFVGASSASAIEFNVTSGLSFTGLLPGEAFTITMEVTNTSGTSVQGMTVDLVGLGGVANVTGGESALHHFVGICATFVGGCAGGVDSVDNVFFSPFDLSGQAFGGTATSGYQTGDDGVRVISALALNPTTQAGGSDPGLLPTINDIFTPSSLDVVLNLVALGTGPVDLLVLFSDGTATIELDTGISFDIVTIPEPGTALLMGLGLVGLAGAGSRRTKE